MSTQWYYAFEGTSKGPFNQTEFDDLIANSTIRSDTLVWQEGMEDWLPLGRTQASARAQPMPPLKPVNNIKDPARDDANTFLGALKDGFARYVDFKTRSTRPQFWWWALWSFLLGLGASIFDAMMGMSDVGVINALLNIAFILPSIAVAVRRLHDIGRTGWWFLLVFIPVLGWIVLLVFYCTRTEDAPNQWGNPPRR